MKSFIGKKTGYSQFNKINIVKVAMILLCFLFINISQINIKGTTDDEYFAGNQLKQIGILQGYSDGTLKLDQPIVRSEVATIMVRIRGYENVEIVAEGKNFSDVKTSFWAFVNIQNAYKLNMIKGYPDNTFKPNNYITYAEVVAMMVNTLGYGNELEGTWPSNYINKAKAIGVIPANSELDPAKVITRGEMALIVWDTLLVKLTSDVVLN